MEGTAFKIPLKTKDGEMRYKMQYYYPFHPPGSQQRDIDINILPLRMSEDYIFDGQQSQPIESGVKGTSPFAYLLTIEIPESCPFDMMHLVFLCFTRDICRLLNGQFFKDSRLNDHNGRLTEKDWEALGIDMSKIGAPTSWGRYPRNIQKYINTFKAEELSNFLVHYLLPLCYGRVNETTYRALQRLVYVVSLSIAYQITYEEVKEIEHHLTLFLVWYYDTFYQNEYERLPACKYTAHSMMHLVQGIRNWASASYFWQFPEV